MNDRNKTNGLRVCRKCLLYTKSREEFFQKLEAYIDNLAEEDRADQTTYEERLRTCAQCPNLTEGMCVLCGCYVELRAALKLQRCPDIERRW